MDRLLPGTEGSDVKYLSPLPLMKRGKPQMTPDQVQRTIDFILRSHADAAIRMERLEERMERGEDRSEEQQQKIDELILVVHEAARASRDAVRASRDAVRASRDAVTAARAHEKRIRSLETSDTRITRRMDSMRDILRTLARLEAHSAKRLDQIEKR